MDDSITHPHQRTAAWELSGWKTVAGAAAAFILCVWFVISGAGKIADPFMTAQNMIAKGVPAVISMPFSLGLSIGEMFAGVLIIVPRYRRLGAWIMVVLLVIFMAYFGFNYAKFKGQDCSCLPLLKEEVGPLFFVRDTALLLLAIAAGWWARPSSGIRQALLILAAIGVFAAVSYGVNARIIAAQKGPATIQVAGKAFPLRQGRVLLFFFNPECLHCRDAALEMKKFQWNEVKIVGVPTEDPQFAPYFMDQLTGLHAPLSADTAELRKHFKFASTPYAVALEDGRLKESISDFDPARFRAALAKADFIR